MKKIKKRKKSHKKQFILEIREDVDKKVDDALKLIECGFIEGCSDLLGELMAEHPDYYMVQYGMGVVHAFRKQYDEAIRFFGKALEVFPYFLEAQFNLAVSYQKKLDVGNAIKAYRKVVEMGTRGDIMTEQAHDFLSGMEESLKKSDGVGLDAYLKGMDKFERAFTLMENQEWEAAICKFHDCLSIVKRHYQSYGNIGICYARLGKKEQALAAFDKALEINPGYEIAAVNRAVTMELEEGEQLSGERVESVDYVRDYQSKNRSYIAELLEEMRRKV
jgi:tetratricopeptide (TPR) repeat protein